MTDISLFRVNSGEVDWLACTTDTAEQPVQQRRLPNREAKESGRCGATDKKRNSAR